MERYKKAVEHRQADAGAELRLTPQTGSRAHFRARSKAGQCMEKMKMAKAVYGEKFNTVVGRVSYPHVFKRSNGMNGKEGKYELTLLVPKKGDLGDLKERIDKVGTEAFGAAWAVISKKKPIIKDGDEYADEKAAVGKDGEVYRGHWYFRAGTSKRIPVVGPDKMALDEVDDAFYGGCYARMNVTPGSYEADGSKGVTLYLNAVQKVKDGERFGGSGSVDADSVFEAFESESAGASSLDDGF